MMLKKYHLSFYFMAVVSYLLCLNITNIVYAAEEDIPYAMPSQQHLQALINGYKDCLHKAMLATLSAAQIPVMEKSISGVKKIIIQHDLRATSESHLTTASENCFDVLIEMSVYPTRAPMDVHSYHHTCHPVTADAERIIEIFNRNPKMLMASANISPKLKDILHSMVCRHAWCFKDQVSVSPSSGALPPVTFVEQSICSPAPINTFEKEYPDRRVCCLVPYLYAIMRVPFFYPLWDTVSSQEQQLIIENIHRYLLDVRGVMVLIFEAGYDIIRRANHIDPNPFSNGVLNQDRVQYMYNMTQKFIQFQSEGRPIFTHKQAPLANGSFLFRVNESHPTNSMYTVKSTIQSANDGLQSIKITLVITPYTLNFKISPQYNNRTVPFHNDQFAENLVNLLKQHIQKIIPTLKGIRVLRQRVSKPKGNTYSFCFTDQFCLDTPLKDGKFPSEEKFTALNLMHVKHAHMYYRIWKIIELMNLTSNDLCSAMCCKSHDQKDILTLATATNAQLDDSHASYLEAVRSALKV